MIEEPLLDKHDIQGHVLPGFGTRYLRIIGLKVSDPDQFRQQIQPKLNDITDAALANNKRLARRESYRETGKRPDDPTVMVAMGFSSVGLKTFTVNIDTLRDRRFKRGMAFDAPEFNDEFDEEGNPIGWLFGDTSETTPDILVLFGCELKTPLLAYGENLIDSLQVASRLLLDQFCDRPDDDKEHFGFKDGVSQPAVRGKLTESDYLYQRYIAPEHPDADYFAKPGQPLIWPGQFVFGYPGQTTDPLSPGQVLNPGPDWMNNGSYLVVRRLRQDVELFRSAVADQSTRLLQQHGVRISPETLMAKLIGRWPDGTPLVVSPNEPDTAVSENSMRINHFNFDAQRCL